MNPSVVALFFAILIASAVPANSEALIPTSAKIKMNAMLGRYGFYPLSLPAGLLFSTWRTTQLAPKACGLNLEISFAGDGKRLDWSSSRDCNETGATACYNDGYPGYDFQMDAEQSAVINGRHVYFSTGNHGSNAWACIPLTAGGSKDMAVVGIWESNFMTAQQAMNLVAAARPTAAR
jgi:hypothetical protein